MKKRAQKNGGSLKVDRPWSVPKARILRIRINQISLTHLMAFLIQILIKNPLMNLPHKKVYLTSLKDLIALFLLTGKLRLEKLTRCWDQKTSVKQSSKE